MSYNIFSNNELNTIAGVGIAQPIPITKTAYMAMSEEERKTSPYIYDVYDDPIDLSADSIALDPITNFDADDVQEAVELLNQNITNKGNVVKIGETTSASGQSFTVNFNDYSGFYFGIENNSGSAIYGANYAPKGYVLLGMTVVSFNVDKDGSARYDSAIKCIGSNTLKLHMLTSATGYKAVLYGVK